jgi:hypothetical protein
MAWPLQLRHHSSISSIGTFCSIGRGHTISRLPAEPDRHDILQQLEQQDLLPVSEPQCGLPDLCLTDVIVLGSTGPKLLAQRPPPLHVPSPTAAAATAATMAAAAPAAGAGAPLRSLATPATAGDPAYNASPSHTRGVPTAGDACLELLGWDPTPTPPPPSLSPYPGAFFTPEGTPPPSPCPLPPPPPPPPAARQLPQPICVVRQQLSRRGPHPATSQRPQQDATARHSSSAGGGSCSAARPAPARQPQALFECAGGGAGGAAPGAHSGEGPGALGGWGAGEGWGRGGAVGGWREKRRGGAGGGGARAGGLGLGGQGRDTGKPVQGRCANMRDNHQHRVGGWRCLAGT